MTGRCPLRSTARWPTLPVLSEEPPERADAARNRGKVLAAAERLFAEHGAVLRVDGRRRRRGGRRQGHAVPRASAIAPGWRWRAAASASAASRRRSSAGRPPLGPGAPPIERLIAFGERLFAAPRRPRRPDHDRRGAGRAATSAAPVRRLPRARGDARARGRARLRLGVHRRHAARGARRRARAATCAPSARCRRTGSPPAGTTSCAACSGAAELRGRRRSAAAARPATGAPRRRRGARARRGRARRATGRARTGPSGRARPARSTPAR